MSDVQHILQKLSALQQRKTKLNAYNVKLGKIDDLVSATDDVLDKYDAFIREGISAIYNAEESLNEAAIVNNQILELAKEWEVVQTSVEDLGLELPGNAMNAMNVAISLGMDGGKSLGDAANDLRTVGFKIEQELL